MQALGYLSVEQTREFERDVVALLYWVAQIEGSFACHKG
jgi:hypothetical protein